MIPPPVVSPMGLDKVGPAFGGTTGGGMIPPPVVSPMGLDKVGPAFGGTTGGGMIPSTSLSSQSEQSLRDLSLANKEVAG